MIVADQITHDNGASANNIVFYVDGSQVFSSTVTIDTDTNDGYDVAIGKFTTVNYFDGSISDVRIYEDIALNAGQVRQMYKDPGAGPIAHLTLDDGSGTYVLDSTDYERNGTTSGSPTWLPTDGKIIGAMEFDGTDDYVEMDGTSGTAWKGISGKHARTCSAWIKVPTYATLKGAVVSWGEFGTAGERWLFRVSTYGYLQLKVGGDVVGDTYLRDNKWHHVALSLCDTNDDGDIKLSEVILYVDGIEEDCTVTSDIAIDTETGASAPYVLIGAYNDGTSYTNLFTGQIDDVKVYNRALSSTEIRKAAFGGGGIYGGDEIAVGDGTKAIISNCIITGNAAEYGGGIYNCDGEINKCTIVYNGASNGGGLYGCDGDASDVTNSIIWYNTGGQITESTLPTYCSIQNWDDDGTGNITACPYFTNAATGNFHIASYSSCIDAGDHSATYSTETNHPTGWLNLGAYGNTSEATSLVTTDADGDGLLDAWEILYFGYTTTVTDQGEDEDGDGLTNYQEFLAGTDPGSDQYADDSDDDGLSDAWEVANGLDPTDDTGVNNDVGDPDGDGMTNEEERDLGMNLSATDDNRGDSWTEYTYNNAGNVLTQTIYQFDATGVTTTAIAKTERSYDILGRVYKTVKRSSSTGTGDTTNDDITLTLHNSLGSVTKTIRKGPGNTTISGTPEVGGGDIVDTFAYDTYNRMTGRTNSLSETTTYAFDAVGSMTRTVGTITTDYAYDTVGRATKTTIPDSDDDYTVTEYDSRGLAIKKMFYDEDGATDIALTQQRYSYDGLGQLETHAAMKLASSTAAASLANGDRITDYATTYDLTNNKITKDVYTYATSSNSITSRTIYTTAANGRPMPTTVIRGISTSQPSVTQTIDYNTDGQVTERITDNYNEAGTASLTLTSRMEYDSYGRVAASVADGDTDLTTAYSYDGLGRRLQVTSPLGQRDAFAYDFMGQMTKKTEDADGIDRETEQAYDRLGRLTDLYADTDNDGYNRQQTQYGYDELGQVTEITYPDSGTIGYTYATGGLVTQRIDQKGVTTAYVYDDLGRLITKQNDELAGTPDIVEVYTYDSLGLMLTANKGTSTGTTDDISAVTLQYDSFGALSTSTQEVNNSGTSKTVSYTRNLIGQATQIDYPDSGNSVTMSYAYTSLGQVDTITRGASEAIADYNYYGSIVAGREYDQINVDFTPAFDSFGRVTTHATLNSSSVGVDFDYTYDDNSNIVSKAFNHRTNDPANVYDYDTLNRVIEADYGYASEDEQFTYDNLGNRLTTVDRDNYTDYYTPDVSNEYDQVIVNGSTKTPAYDANGNLTTDIKDYTYHYDHDNRVTEIRKTSDTVTVATYDYDALGRRIEKYDAVADVTTRYYYDGQRVLLEEEDSGGGFADARYFVYGNYIDEVLMMRDVGTSEDYYYGHDHLFSPCVLFDDAGDVVERYEYNAYGKATIWDATFSNTRNSSNYDNPYLFTGRRLDILDGGSLEIYYYRARYYDADTGRFLQCDPLEYIDGMNIYEYVRSMATIYLDPLGLSIGDWYEEYIENELEPVPDGETPSYGLCAYVRFIISKAAELSPINNALWERYMRGKGGSHEVPFEWFDPFGKDRKVLIDHMKNGTCPIMLDAACGLPKNSSSSGRYSGKHEVGDQKRGRKIINGMINKYTIHWKTFVLISKDGECNGSATIDYTFRAKDRTDFNKGDTFSIPPYEIHDELVNQCNLGKPFYIISNEDEGTIDCGTKKCYK